MRIPAFVGLAVVLGGLNSSRAEAPISLPAPVPAESVPGDAAVPRATPVGDEAKWIVNVQRLAGVLNGTLPAAELNVVVSPRAWMSPFERNRSEAAIGLAGRLPTRNVVSVRGYIHPSVTAATDLVADLVGNGTIDPSILKDLVPPPGRDLHQADATMARWFAAALDATEGEPIGLIALYDDGRESGTRPQLYLVILRGEINLSDGEPVVSRLLYGTLDAATR